ncbi:MAG TPA: multicopper oxidase domain-containing protein [Acetobacteraceae bacterium]|nr:multicopper oxidase domain-containing protein [Acetobacteraceae bacterium]
MGGVPGLTQKSIAPGDRFDYAFTPPDAGTFWYHSHDDSLVQMGRGLAGAHLDHPNHGAALGGTPAGDHRARRPALQTA